MTKECEVGANNARFDEIRLAWAHQNDWCRGRDDRVMTQLGVYDGGRGRCSLWPMLTTTEPGNVRSNRRQWGRGCDTLIFHH
jgi:hypothetical protein